MDKNMPRKSRWVAPRGWHASTTFITWSTSVMITDSDLQRPRRTSRSRGPSWHDRLLVTPLVVDQVGGLPCGGNGVIDRDGDIGHEEAARIDLARRGAQANITDAVQRPMAQRR